MAKKVSIRNIGYAVALLGVSVPVAMPTLGHGKGMVALMRQVATDPFSLLAARSPGERNEARLVSTKRRHNPVIGAVPEEFATALAFSGAPPQSLADGLPPSFPTVAEEIAPTFGKAPFLPLQDGPGPGMHGGGWSIPIIPIGIGGSGGAPPGGGDGEPPVDTVPLPGIPEPSSWSLLLIGFLMAGASLRADRFDKRGRS